MPKASTMTRYIAAYDTEKPECLAACRRIVAVHRRHNVPGTFFIVGKTLHDNPREYRELLGDDGLFEVGSHTWSHRMLRDHPFCGPAPDPQAVADEIILGQQAVQDVFGRACIGLRPGCGFVDGLRGAPQVLAHVRAAGFRYVSSLLWGPDWSVPAPLTQGFTYEADGFGDLWELPGHGWHENLLKNHNEWGPRRVTLWPAQMPEAIPAGFIKTPQEEAAVNRIFIEEAVRQKLGYVSLIWHPWSLLRFDPEMRMLDLTFRMVKDLRLTPSTYADVHRALCAAPR
jgi:hypothetical protein